MLMSSKTNVCSFFAVVGAIVLVLAASASAEAASRKKPLPGKNYQAVTVENCTRLKWRTYGCRTFWDGAVKGAERTGDVVPFHTSDGACAPLDTSTGQIVGTVDLLNGRCQVSPWRIAHPFGVEQMGHKDN